MDSLYLQSETQIEDNHISHLPWKALLDEPLCYQAQEAALLVAQRLRDPEDVQRIAQLAEKQSSFPSRWDLSLPSAAAELALFYSYVACCFPEHGWHTIAQHYLKLVALSSQQHSLTSPALFGGMSGIAFVVQHFSEAGQRYQQTLAHLHRSLAQRVRQLPCWQRSPEEGVAESDFDIIVGASGIVGYLASIASPDSIVREILHTLLGYLLALTKPGQLPGQERWLCPPSLLVTESDRQHFPYGRFNCGLAHGIPGPLAALSLAALAGYDVPGLHESIAYVSTWLVQHQIQDAWGGTWPTHIPYELASSPEEWHSLPPSRTAWCYGTPGVARSLWLAGQALRDDHLMGVALDAIKGVLCRPLQIRDIDAPTLCHGIAGLLLICLRFAHESQDPFLLQQIPALVEQILAQFDPQSPSGFRDREPGGILVDRPDFLNGAAGTALALLAAATAIAPSWDRLLLVS